MNRAVEPLALGGQKVRALVEGLTSCEDVPANLRERAAEFKPSLQLIETSLKTGTLTKPAPKP
ncbi:hypothetical protein [Streptomyces sp. NBC_00158]|uniref:hypothetical protein n=1 Tax=Streptomyces sp. NBC_00158 TaxID=2903627 RepID=UPI00324B4F15